MRRYKETIKIPNPDISNETQNEKIQKSISEFLNNLGESSAAKFIDDNFKKDTINYSKNIEKLQKENNDEIVKISMINSGILEKLDDIEKYFKKGQDTSVEKIEKVPVQKTAIEQVREINTNKEKENNSLGIFEMFLGGILGVGMLAFLKGFKNLGPISFAVKMVQLGWDSIKDKIVTLATTISKSVMAPIEDLIKYIVNKLNKIPGFENLNKPKIKTPEKPDQMGKKSILKKVSKLGGKSLAKKIPILGLTVAGSLALNRLSEKDYIGAGLELASGVLGTLGAFTFGGGTAASFGVDAALAARDENKRKEEYDEHLISKLIEAGILDKGFFGDITIEDWERLMKLPQEDISTVLKLPNLNTDDKSKMGNELFKNELKEIKEPENKEEYNESGVKVMHDKREVLASEVIESKNKLKDFIAENKEKERKLDTGTPNEPKYVGAREIYEQKMLKRSKRYEDESINAEYIKLKKIYQENLVKYKNSITEENKSLSSVDKRTEMNLAEGKKMLNSEKYSEMALNDIITPLSNKLEDIPNVTGELAQRIKTLEGLKLTQYYDSEGNPTIGYGHLIKPNEKHLMGATITKEEAEKLFAKDFEYHKNAAMKIPSFKEHSKEIQDVFIDMTFNMGPNWYRNWPNTIANLTEKNYMSVRNNILNSLYAKQVKNRAKINAKVFEKEAEIKMASKNVKTPDVNFNKFNTIELNENINILNKNNAIEQKQTRVQMTEEINRNLVKNTSSVNNVINNYNSTSTNNKTTSEVETKKLSSLFGNYT